MAVGAAAVVVLVAVVGAAVGGSWELEDRNFDFGSRDEPGQLLQPELQLELGPLELPDEVDSSVDLSWLATVFTVIAAVALVALAAGALAWAVRWLWLRLRYRDAPRRHAKPTGGAAAVAADEEEPQLPVLQRGVAEAQRFLAEIDRPVDAVVAAWLALEEAAEVSGVRRLPAQTPTEFTVAVLTRTRADADAVSELLGLYHRARFSRRPLEAEVVARASSCLGRLAASWELVSTAGVGRR